MSTQLADLGIPIMEGYRKENLSPRPDLVIVGNVISRTHEEAQALLATDIPYTSLPAALGEYAIGGRESIVIAGTHGKTTTTSLMSWVAEACGKKPGFLIGGIPINFSRSFRAPEGNWFVVEGDEYDTAFFDKVPKFIHYKPKYAVLTSVEFDHADIYSDLEAVKRAFAMLIERIPADGLLWRWNSLVNVEPKW
jgi:UDP-N-acetylmuramate: L-alanyl-gamma-D-glutamyl-meso-diaminopimelate ligase